MGVETFAKWTQVTVEELQAYMGFMILIGIVHLPSIYDYWKKDKIYHYSPVASRISRDRFSLNSIVIFTSPTIPYSPFLVVKNMTSREKSS